MKTEMDQGNLVLGIEFGSTRIKAVLIDRNHRPVASGSYEWENVLENGIWTYRSDEIVLGMQSCYADLKKNYEAKTGGKLTRVGAIGISGMMHGYLPFDRDGRQLVPFRTWRNTMTGEAADKLTALFGFTIPQRWSIAHLYQAILSGEEHLPRIDYLTTLSGYIHRLLTGQRVLGIGEASGMFPIDSETLDYDEKMIGQFEALPEVAVFPWKLRGILPRAIPAGKTAGELTGEGAKLLDESGELEPGIPFAPPEGDVGTGMVATNSVAVRTGNVSAGTSAFSMIVTEKLPGVHREIQMVVTPAGLPAAMVHSNTCTSDLNAWMGLFGEFAEALGTHVGKDELFGMMFNRALDGEPDGGGLLNYNSISGETTTGLNDGRPIFTRLPNSAFTLDNFMRVQIMSSLAVLKMGLDILIGTEGVTVDRLFAHGGLFRTRGVAQRLLSAAVGAPVSVMETAGEGGPYGMALLASYMLYGAGRLTLEEYLKKEVFSGATAFTVTADEKDVRGFAEFTERYKKGLAVEKAAVENL